jgi:hypothetical protein
MKRRKWKPEQKALIVLEGLKGRPIGALSDVMEPEVLEAVAAAGTSKMLDRPTVPAAS